MNTGEWRETFLRGNYWRKKPGCVVGDPLAARRTALKRLSAKQSCLVKYDRWAKDDERRVYTLRQTLYVCYDLLEKKPHLNRRTEHPSLDIPPCPISSKTTFSEDMAWASWRKQSYVASCILLSTTAVQTGARSSLAY